MALPIDANTKVLWDNILELNVSLMKAHDRQGVELAEAKKLLEKVLSDL